MRNFLYILTILISNQLFGTTFFVDGSAQSSCNDHGEGSLTTPFCHIQAGINAIEASESGCGDANFNCVDDPGSCGEFDPGPQLNFAQVCTVQVANSGIYIEALTIQKDMVIISQSAATMANSLEFDEIYNQNDLNTYIETLDFPTISP